MGCLLLLLVLTHKPTSAKQQSHNAQHDNAPNDTPDTESPWKMPVKY